MRAFTGCRILPVCRSAGLNVIAAGILAMSCGSAPAQQDFPEGAWAIGNRNSCSTRPYELHIAQDVWQFTDARHAVNVEKVLSASGRKYLTETISSPDVPRGTRWTYIFTGDTVGLVSNSLGTSFTIFRCTDLPADARASPSAQPRAIVSDDGSFEAQRRLFERPVSTRSIPATSDTDPIGEIRCTYYPEFMIRETGTDSPDPNAATILPGGQTPCDANHVAGERSISTEHHSLLGKIGRFLVFAATDRNGAIPFMIFDSATSTAIYIDATAADQGFRKVADMDGVLHLQYRRGLNASCSIMKDAPGCWARLVAEGKLPRAMAQSIPSPLACAAAYKRDKATPDDPSVIMYDTAITIDLAGKTQVLWRGPVQCGAMP